MPRPVLPKRCELCGARCTKQPSGYWLCASPAPEGCGWSDDPGTVQPQAATPQVVEASPASAPPAEN